MVLARAGAGEGAGPAGDVGVVVEPVIAGVDVVPGPRPAAAVPDAGGARPGLAQDVSGVVDLYS